MPDLFAYLEGFGTGESFTKSVIIVTDLPTGSTVTATKGETEKTATEENGKWWFRNLDLGEWTLKATLGDQSATTKFNIEQFGVYYVSMAYRLTPEFTYTGDYEVVDDDDRPIEDFAGWTGNWKIRFLTSGTFTVTNMYGWDGNIDAFLDGAGGGNNNTRAGGAGGYTLTATKIHLNLLEPYTIEIGAGTTSSGGNTTAFQQTANGGEPGSYDGANGGTGGGGADSDGTVGGLGGQDGEDGKRGYYPGGKGQGTTTREFGEPGAKLYSTGGNGGLDSTGNNPADADDNTGNGAHGNRDRKTQRNAKGGSGIVIIRNARAA